MWESPVSGDSHISIVLDCRVVPINIGAPRNDRGEGVYLQACPWRTGLKPPSLNKIEVRLPQCIEGREYS
jgi:hypothetical protein